MSKKFKTISLIILVAFLTIILGIIPEVIGDKAKEISEYYFREKYEYFLFTFFIVGSFIVVWLTTDLKKNLSSNKYESSNKNIENEISKIRTSLKESYQDRINSKLANRYPINLKIKYSLKGTTTKAPNYINNTFGYNKIKEELHKIFEKHGGRLLMIGEAGSGKTTLLIQLALILIEKKEERIPLIINIATWRERFKTVEEWLIELLPQMGISKPLSQFLINGKRLLPLFDGLDELAKEKRKKCLEAIGEYGESNNLKFAICSRPDEYAQTVDAPVYFQIEVLPLKIEQIKQQLKKVSTPESNGMLHAINNDKLLAKAVQIPFYLNTTQILFSSGKALSEFDFKSIDLEGRNKELIEFFIDKSLIKVSHSKKKSNHWTSFLAYEMNHHNLVVFELLSLQYSWSSWSKNIITFSYFLKGLVLGLVFGLVVGLVVGLAVGLIEGLVEGLVVGVVTDLIVGLVVGLVYFLQHKKVGRLVFGLVSQNINTNNSIKTKEKIIWSFIPFVSHLKEKLVVGLVIGVVFGLSLYFIVGVVEGLVGALVGTLSLIFSFGFLDLLWNNNYSFIQLKTSYQRFRASAKNFYFSIIQHFVLRYQLYKKGALPFRLVSFLKELTQNNLLESDGATWRFRHRILQDYFADKWKEKKDKE